MDSGKRYSLRFLGTILISASLFMGGFYLGKYQTSPADLFTQTVGNKRYLEITDNDSEQHIFVSNVFSPPLKEKDLIYLSVPSLEGNSSNLPQSEYPSLVQLANLPRVYEPLGPLPREQKNKLEKVLNN